VERRAPSPWLAVVALAAGALAAWLAVRLAPTTGDDVARARELGIVSVSILAGHSKSAESLAYFAALASGIAAGALAWRALAGKVALATRAAAVPVVALELALVALALYAVFGRAWRLPQATMGPWPFLAEEGEMLAWADVVLRGGALSRDVFCLYGPLATWSVAFLFRVFGPSIVVWRAWIYGASAAGLVAAYLLLRGLLRTRTAALVATLAIGLVCSTAIPGMSWSASRVGLGLGALACLCRAYGADPRRWLAATGALLGLALLYSQEVGVACALAVVAALALRPDRVRVLAWTAAGGAALLAPAVAYIAAQGALAATIDNLFVFPRIRVLGFGALPFPALALARETLVAYFVPVVLGVSGIATAARWLGGERGARVGVELALFVFGALLFAAALSRPDTNHFAFAAPPALVLLAGLVEDAALLAASRAVALAARAAGAAAVALAAAALAPWWSWAGGNLFSFAAPIPADFRTLNLDRAGGALVPDGLGDQLEQLVAAVRDRTAPDEPIWVFPNEALIYYLADRPQATRFPLALFAVTRAQRLELVAELERTRPRYAVVWLHPIAVDGIVYEQALPEVVDYMVANYVPEARFGTVGLLRRKS